MEHRIYLKTNGGIEWHNRWMDYHLSEYRRDRQLPYIERIDPENRMQCIPFVQYLREKGYNAWRFMPLAEDDCIYVKLTEEEYIFEQLRFQ